MLQMWPKYFLLDPNFINFEILPNIQSSWFESSGSEIWLVSLLQIVLVLQWIISYVIHLPISKPYDYLPHFLILKNVDKRMEHDNSKHLLPINKHTMNIYKVVHSDRSRTILSAGVPTFPGIRTKVTTFFYYGLRIYDRISSHWTVSVSCVRLFIFIHRYLQYVRLFISSYASRIFILFY